MPSLQLDPQSTALVLIDLQQGIVAGQAVPHSAADVVSRAARLARRFRERHALVILVHVDLGPNGELFPSPQADQARPVITPPPGWTTIVPDLGPEHERGYEQVFVEDAMAAREADLHTYPVTRVFPTIGRVRSTADVLAALA